MSDASRLRGRDIVGGARAMTVMSGAQLALGIWASAGTLATVRAIRARRRPRAIALLAPAIVLGWFAVRPWTRRWNATPDEVEAQLPGDDFVPDAGVTMTRAVTVDAPPAEVWPWIAQIGQDRGGFYSYTRLENLAGCQMRNADRVHEEWQDRAIGEPVPLHPLNALPITRFDPGRTYALGGWYFNLVPTGDDRTRLIARTRVPRGLASVAYAAFVEAPHFVMERRMLLQLKALIEADRGRTGEGRALEGPSTAEPAAVEQVSSG
jgi:hypothetical protein